VAHRFRSTKDEVIAMYDEQFLIYRNVATYLGGSRSGFRYVDLSLSQLQ